MLQLVEGYPIFRANLTGLRGQRLYNKGCTNIMNMSKIYEQDRMRRTIHPPLRFPEDNPTIAIPNSMWTAGWFSFPHYHPVNIRVLL